MLVGIHDARTQLSELLERVAAGVPMSAARVGEASIKTACGKLRLPAAGALPSYHCDPFDRMLVAESQIEGLAVVTRDPLFDPYDVGVVHC